MSRVAVLSFVVMCLVSCTHTQPSLINSSSKGNLSEIKAFIKSGSNINEPDNYGYARTPLMHAIANNQIEAARYLIQAGADVKIQDSYGYDALIIASEMGNDCLELIDLMLDKGADINSKDKAGWTPIMHTINVNNSLKTARLLIKRGADLNVKDPDTQKSLYDMALYYRNPGLAVEFKEAMARNGKADEYDTKIVFIRESNPLMLTNYYTDISINGRIITMNLKEAGSDYIGVRSGKQDIIIKGSWYEGSYKISLDAQSGKTYYFELVRRAGNVAATMIGGVLVGSIEAAANGDKAGPVEIVPIEESIAKAKLEAMKSR